MTYYSDLIADLRSLADADDRAGEPLGRCMREAGDVLDTVAKRVRALEKGLRMIRKIARQRRSDTADASRADSFASIYRICRTLLDEDQTP